MLKKAKEIMRFVGKMLSRALTSLFKKKDCPVKGSIVYCDLGKSAAFFEHSGVYVGNGKIVHRDGDGKIEKVSPKEFLNRLDGKNIAKSIYVSYRGVNAAGSDEVAKRALTAVSDSRHKGYGLLTKNCHQFCQYCLTGEEKGITDCSLASLKGTLKEVYECDDWRKWNIDI